MELDIQKLDDSIKKIKKREKLSNKDIANVMGIDYSYLFKILNRKIKPGKKIFDAVSNFCREYKLNPNDYIFLN